MTGTVHRFVLSAVVVLAGCGPSRSDPGDAGTTTGTTEASSPSSGLGASETGAMPEPSSTGTTNAGSESGEPPPLVECHTGYPWVMCNEECTNIAADPANCGECNRVCEGKAGPDGQCREFMCEPGLWPCVEETAAPAATCADACAAVGETCAGDDPVCGGSIVLYSANISNPLQVDQSVEACMVGYSGNQTVTDVPCSAPIPWDQPGVGSTVVVAARCCCTQTWSFPD